MYNTSFCKYLTKLTVVFALFALLPIALGSFGIASTIGSYLMSILCFFIITIVSAKLVLGENRYVRFYAIVFIVEILIGLLHYLYFVDSTYFSTNGDASGAFWHEYLSVYDAVSRLNDTRNSYGVFYWMTADEFQVTHPEIWHIISWPFYYLGNKWLNYSALNVFCCLLTSMNLVCLYLNFYPVNEDAEKKIRLWTAFFPSFLLSGTVWRDPFGIALISVGVVLTMLSRNMIEKVAPCMQLVDYAKDAIRELGMEPNTDPIRGGTDGAQLSFRGLPCPNLGTGGYAFHGPYEHITAEGMDTAVHVMLGILKRFAQ